MAKIIIAGVPRSGKSTLTKKIAVHLNLDYIPFDSIVSTMGNLYPEHGITHFDNAEKVSKQVAIF